MKNNKNEINIEDFGFIKYGEFYHDVHIHLVNGEILTTLEMKIYQKTKRYFMNLEIQKIVFLILLWE